MSNYLLTEAGDTLSTEALDRLIWADAPPPVALVPGWDLPNARVRIRLAATDTARDAELAAVMALSLAAVEHYTNRFIGQKTGEEEIVIPLYGTRIQLHRLPVQQITSITSVHGATIADYHVDRRAGLLRFPFFCAHEVSVVYDGGLIDDVLLFALWQVFDSAWAATTGAASVSTGAAIKAISSDGARVEYDTGGASVSGAMPVGLIPGLIAQLLDPYRIIEA
jgi:hypothetical protein